MELFDKSEAEAFLNALDPQASSFTFQTFDDNADRKAPSLARTLQGSLNEVCADLCALSEQGAGVFVSVNETDGRGRKADNITRIRALYGDFDGVTTNRLKAWLPPNIEVQTSSGNSHLYWLGEFTVNQHHAFMNVLTTEFGADPGAKDIARVLRLPGFPHQKIDSKKGLNGSKEIVRTISATPLSDLTYDFAKDIAPKLLAVARSTPSEPANQNTPPQEGVKAGGQIDLGQTDSSAKDCMRAMLEAAPNNLLRNDWVKLAKSLQYNWGDEFCDAFVQFSLKYQNSSETEAEARRIWNEKSPAHTAQNIGSAFNILKSDMGEASFREIQRNHNSLSGLSWQPLAPTLKNSPQVLVSPDQFKIWQANELAAEYFPPVQWLNKDILPTPGLAMIAGAPKVGKSWFALSMALEMASAGNSVLYVGSEDSSRRLSDRIKALCPFPPHNLYLMACLSNDTSLPRGESGLEFLAKIKQQMPELRCIIIDTVASIRRASLSEKNYEETEAEFAPMRRLAHDLDLALMVVHHTRKDSGNPSTPIERIMGSQGIGATIETAIVLEQRPGSKDIIAHVVGKEVEGGEFAYRWDSPGFSFQGAPEVATLGSFQEKCYAFIKQHPRCMQKAIVDALDTDKGSVSRAVAKLIERGLIEKDQRDALIATS